MTVDVEVWQAGSTRPYLGQVLFYSLIFLYSFLSITGQSSWSYDREKYQYRAHVAI